LTQPVVLKEFDALYGDSYYKLRMRLLSREGRVPILDLRWFNHRQQEWTSRGVSLPVESLDSLMRSLTENIEEIKQLASNKGEANAKE